MDIKEHLVEERNRLSRLGVSVSIICLLLAMWARDPLLKIKLPLSGAEIDNLTAGHVVLIGFPLATFLFLWVAGQAMRMNGLYESLNVTDRKSMAWKAPKSEIGPRLLSDVISYAAIGARYIVIVIFPFVATLVLFTSFFDFGTCVDGGEACTHGEEVSTTNFLFSTELWEVRPSYFGLTPEECDQANQCPAVEARNEEKENIRRHLPYIYAPLQSWIYITLQLLNTATAWYLSLIYFRKSD